MIFGIVLALCCRLAHAQPYDDAAIEKAENHSRLGVERYQAGRYAEAIREMLAAYQAVPDAALHYNVARIYQAMGQGDLALTYFKQFVTAPDADPDMVQQALDHMATLEPERAAEKSEAGPPDTKEDVPKDPAVAEPEPGGGDSTGGSGVLPWVVGGVGAGAVVGGSITGLLSLQANQTYQDVTLPFAERLEAQSSGRSLALTTDVLMVTGALGLAGGWWLLRRGGQTQARLVPLWNDEQFALVVAVR